MQIPRLFVAPACINERAKSITLEDSQITNRLLNVLRMRSGDLVDILDGTGQIFHSALTDACNRKRCQLEIKDVQTADGESQIKLVVSLPLLKAGRFEWAIEKLTEIGAHEIVPLETSRSLSRLAQDDKTDAQTGRAKREAKGDAKAQASMTAKLERWTAIARESAEQSERAMIPNMVRPHTMKDLLAKHKQAGSEIIICAERKSAEPLSRLLTSKMVSPPQVPLVVLVGPEGGFTDEEFQLAEDAGAVRISLGKRVLRSETAAVYTAALLFKPFRQSMTPPCHHLGHHTRYHSGVIGQMLRSGKSQTSSGDRGLEREVIFLP